MKITEIIATESLTGDIVRGAIGLGKKAMSKGGSAADDAARGAEAAKSFWAKQAEKVQAKQAAKNAAAAEREMAAFVTKHYSAEAMKWINFFGLANAAYDYYKGNAALKAQYPNGGPEYDKAYRELLGLTISQAIAPKIAIWASDKLRITKLLSAFPGFIKLLGMPNAASIINSLGSAGAKAALTAWFGTAPGKEWLSTAASGMITGTIGNLAVFAGNIMKVLAGVATGEKSVSDLLPGSDSTSPGDSEGKPDVAGTSSGQGSQSSDQPTQANNPNRLQKVNPYDFSAKDINDKKDYYR